jgi:DNA-binding transcriptional ArsR family regulator
MPFEVIDTPDALTDVVELRTSAVYELLLSIRTLLKPARWHEAWAQRAHDSLTPELREELTYLYQHFSEGGMYFEFPVDYPDHSDVQGFFRYMRSLSDADFMFYLLGRIVSRAQLPKLLAKPNPADLLREALISFNKIYDWYTHNLEIIVADIAGFKARLVDAWERYWDTFLRFELDTLEACWNVGLQEKEMVLQREGGRALYEKVTGKDKLPQCVPMEMDYNSITFIPVCLLPSRVYQFFGYGNVTILFDPQYTEDRREAVKHAKEEAVSTLKALDDETRLKILRLIVQHGSRMHGKNIAEHLKISASAVSRHLALLKEGGLVVEDPQKNLIAYRFEKETLTRLIDKLLDYLYG